MPSIPELFHIGKVSYRRIPARKRVMYPWLPAILDEDSLGAIATLETDELTFIRLQGKGRRQYLYALYLKAVAALGHAHFQPRDLPRQFRQRMIEQLELDASLMRIMTIDRGEKSHIVSAIRTFLGITPVSQEEKARVRQWLQDDLATKESDMAVLINAAIERFRQLRVEIPSRNALYTIARQASQQAVKSIQDMVNRNLGADDRKRLDALFKGRKGRTLFEDLKAPTPQATTNNLAKELFRIHSLQALLPPGLSAQQISRHHLERFADQARRYTAPEILQLNRAKSRTLQYCFIANRYSMLLDASADMIIRVRDNMLHTATNYANSRQQAMSDDYEQYHKVLSTLLAIIRNSRSPEELWLAVHQFKSLREYDGLSEELEDVVSWNACYLAKIEDHYSALRRFLPAWYRHMPLCSTTMDDTIPAAQAFMRDHDTAAVDLPTEGCPTDFLSPPWTNRAVKRFARTEQVVCVVKMPYEMGLLDATAQGLKRGTIAITGAQRYAPMLDHLLPREAFLNRYTDHARRLGLPPKAHEDYAPDLSQLDDDLDLYDRTYAKHDRTFWVNQDGTLGYSSYPGQRITPRLKWIRNQLARKMPEVSILDALMDCQNWTGFMDAFKPVSGRQNMPEKDRLRHILAALYAYGCNCGPTQAARSLQMLSNQVVYMRRRYMATPNLMEAAAILSHAYQRTPMAERLGNLNVLLTDSMQIRTLKGSLIARQHHRYLSGKSTLLYQHVTANCICLFTQALLCNVSEAIHMLVGALQCRNGQEDIINICDSAGKSHLVLGLSRLLNIKLYHRIRSRQLKLWGTDKNKTYKNIGAAIAGQIRPEKIDKGWRDILWILASIEAGTAKPAIILNHLLAQPHHPAAQGLVELGKLEQSSYALHYGMDMDLRRFVVPFTSRREHWNKFARKVQAFGDLIREKTLEDQEEVFWFLTVVQNAIVLWNALSLEDVLYKTDDISSEDLNRILPTMVRHINFVGRFDLDFTRKPPFELKQVIG